MAHRWSKAIALGVMAVTLSGALASPADAQLVHRNNDGQLFFDPILCQTDYQVRQAIAAQGFTNIFLNAPIEDRIRVRATRGKTIYLIDYNRCRPRIISVTPLRAAN